MTTTVSLDSTPYMFLTTATTLTGVFAIHGCLIGFDFLAKLLFALNIRNFRYRGLHIRANVFFVLFTFLFSIAVITSISLSQAVRNFMQGYVDTCATRFRVGNEKKFLASEHDTDTIFGTNMNWILAAVILNLFMYGFAMLHILAYSLKEVNSRILQLKHPWEQGFFGKPNKPLLVQYTKERHKFEAEVMSAEFTQRLAEMQEQKARAMQALNASGYDYDHLSPLGPPPNAPMEELATDWDQPEQGGAAGEEPAWEGGEEGADLIRDDDERRHRRRRHRRDRNRDGEGDDGEGGGGGGDEDDERRRHRRRRHRRSRDDRRDSQGAEEELEPGDIEVTTGAV